VVAQSTDRQPEPHTQGVLELGLPIPAQRRGDPASGASGAGGAGGASVGASGSVGGSDSAGADETDDVLDSDLPERAAPASRTGLDEREERILAFERQWWKQAGAKEQAIRETFEVSSTRYYQQLNRLLDDPRALEFDPALVNRLRRLRMSRARSRA
jgi:Protein of unknown function (DUF3263)